MRRHIIAPAAAALVIAACSDAPTSPGAAGAGRPRSARNAGAFSRDLAAERRASAQLSVIVSGPCPSCVVRVNNTVRTFTATATGGDGTYTYQWRVVRPSGDAYPLGNARTQEVNFTCYDQGYNRVEVVVYSGGLQASGARQQHVEIPPESCGV